MQDPERLIEWKIGKTTSGSTLPTISWSLPLINETEQRQAKWSFFKVRDLVEDGKIQCTKFEKNVSQMFHLGVFL